MILKHIYYHVLYVLCVCFKLYFFLSNLYLYNTALSILFCVNKDNIIIITFINSDIINDIVNIIITKIINKQIVLPC